MLRARAIPCLQLVGASLVKTVRFGKYGYIGDPINTVRIFNELEVDELCFLDIRATLEKRAPNLRILEEIADECFMPLSYGGGIRDVEVARHILSIGFEKLVVNTAALEVPALVPALADRFGTQSVIGSLDVHRNILGGYGVRICDGTKKVGVDPVAWARALERMGAGELLVTSMDRDGTWTGYDVEITRRIADAVSIPVIANGGAGSVKDIGKVVRDGHASAAALGSMVVYQGQDLGVLVNCPSATELAAALVLPRAGGADA
jgi:cyclase